MKDITQLPNYIIFEFDELYNDTKERLGRLFVSDGEKQRLTTVLQRLDSYKDNIPAEYERRKRKYFEKYPDEDEFCWEIFKDLPEEKPEPIVHYDDLNEEDKMIRAEMNKLKKQQDILKQKKYTVYRRRSECD